MTEKERIEKVELLATAICAIPKNEVAIDPVKKIMQTELEYINQVLGLVLETEAPFLMAALKIALENSVSYMDDKEKSVYNGIYEVFKKITVAARVNYAGDEND